MNLDKFYVAKNAVSQEDKIKAIERQLQLMPNRQMGQGQWLKHLEGKYTKMIHYSDEWKAEKDRDHWTNKYNMVDDRPVNGKANNLGIDIKTYGSEYY